VASNNLGNELFASLNPSILVEKALGPDRLSLQVWAAILSSVVHDAYSLTPDTESSFVSVGKFSKTEARISYSRHLSPRWDARVDGQLQFYALSVEEALYQLSCQGIISIAYKF
jgi:hypothetical protein